MPTDGDHLFLVIAQNWAIRHFIGFAGSRYVEI